MNFFPTHCLTKLTVLHRSRSWLRLSQPCSRSSSRRWNPRDRGTKKGSVSGWCCLDLSNRYENKIEEIVDILIFERMSSSNTSFRIFLLRLIICPLNFKGIPTPRGSVSVIGSGSSSISCRLGSIGIHCDAWKWRGDWFPSVTMYSNRTQYAADAAARRGYSLSSFKQAYHIFSNSNV